MSFKRDGNDSSMLSQLQKRLVGDLLVTHIPNDEARLLSNGRYTCTVCSYRPVFDTVDVLAIHRKGKKHLQNLARFLEYRQRKNLSSDLLHQNDTTANTSQKMPIKSKSSTLTSGGSPYNSCCKKRKKLTDRKIALGVEKAKSNIKNVESSSENVSSTTVLTYLNAMKTKNSFQTTIEKSKEIQNYAAMNKTTITTERFNIPVPPPKSVGNLPTEVKETIKKNLELFKDGWKLNANGEWQKDDDAEFDSDEEAPPLIT